jgi:HK97 family phage portal protein
LTGNGVAWIQRQQSGAPKALWPIPWSRCNLELVGQRVRYLLALDDQTSITVWEDDVLHIPGSPEWVDIYAKSPISAYSDSVGIGLEANRFARKYFENDATPSGYISYPNRLAAGSNQADEIRNHWKQKFGGDNRHSGPAVLTDGGEFKQLSINAHDAQLLDTRRFQIEDIARIFGIPRFLLALDETSWGSGIEQLGIFFIRYTLGPHMQAIRDECDWKLFGTDNHFCDFDSSELLKGDTKSIMEAARLSLGGSSGPGIKTQNEWRRDLNLPRVTDPNADNLTNWSGNNAKTSEPPEQQS